MRVFCTRIGNPTGRREEIKPRTDQKSRAEGFKDPCIEDLGMKHRHTS